jgi:hypothetical protein
MNYFYHICLRRKFILQMKHEISAKIIFLKVFAYNEKKIVYETKTNTLQFILNTAEMKNIPKSCKVPPV